MILFMGSMTAGCEMTLGRKLRDMIQALSWKKTGGCLEQKVAIE
jgi:hypothetical protein